MRIPCVGALVHDADRRLLVVRRARPPAVGLWSVPGGRIEAGESAVDAVVREVREETGLLVRAGALVGTVERPGLDGATYEIADYAATAAGGTLRAGDDAADARWVTYAELRALPLTPGLLEALEGWGQLPA